MMRIGRIFLVGAICATQIGCSFVFVKSPPPPGNRRQDPFEPVADCTETRIPPIVDVVAASIAGVFIAFAAVDTLTGTPLNATAQQNHHYETIRAEMFWGGLVGSGITVASAIWGFRTTRKCREYVDEKSTKDVLWLTPPSP
jgi:hypothetical protein